MTEREKIVEVMARSARDHEWRGLNGPDWNGPGEKEYWLGMAEHLLTALEASGMAVVPREPTEAMVDAGGSSIIRPSVYMGGVPPGAKRRARDIWADMLAASPTPSMTENADE